MRLVVILAFMGMTISPVLGLASESPLAGRVAVLEEVLGQGVVQAVQISGTIEAEAGYSSGYADAKESDVDLTALELAIDVALADNLSGFALMKWEEDGGEGVYLDEGGITFGNTDTYGIAATVGKLYVPFGVYETGMISDSLTLELGEIREGALVVDLGADGFYGAAYTFNSAINDSADDDMIDSFGFMAGYEYSADPVTIDVSAGWISNLTSSAGFCAFLEDYSVTEVDDYTAGATVSAVINIANFTVIGEYLTALGDDYLSTESLVPEAWVFELGYDFNISNHAASVAITYQGSDEAVKLGLPRVRVGGAFGVEIGEGLGVALEYVHDEDYSFADGGTDDSADAVTCQLVFEF